MAGRASHGSGGSAVALLATAMLVRHAMHGGVIVSGAPTLADRRSTLIAIGTGAILVAIDMRSPSSVLRYGSIAAGVVSAASIAVQHFLVLNPLLSDRSTGRIRCSACCSLPISCRRRQPAGWRSMPATSGRWYAAMLALVAALLACRTLSVRRLFKGEFIGLWAASAARNLHLFRSLAGHRRCAAHCRRLAEVARAAHRVGRADFGRRAEGLHLRHVGAGRRVEALSFIGLGAVLIGIGLFYQRLLTRAAKRGVR
jgi:uncharacterized membrane protein